MLLVLYLQLCILDIEIHYHIYLSAFPLVHH